MSVTFKIPPRKQMLFKSILEFEKGQALGSGAFATVYEAVHITSKKKYALKQVNLTKIAQVDYENVFKELEIHSRLSSPFVVKMYDFWKEGTMVNLVLEFCQNGNLYRHMNTKKLTEIDIKKFFVQIVMGIKYLHSQGVIMRDLKPENVVLDESMNAKICDFGWAANVRDIAYCSIKAGTYSYMSPESLQGVLQTEKTDNWALGVFLYELCYNKEPWKGRSCNDMLKKIKTNAIDFSAPILPQIRELIVNLLKFHAKDRLEIKSILQSQFFREAIFSVDALASQNTNVKSQIELNTKEKQMNYSQLFKTPTFTNTSSSKQVTTTPSPNLVYRSQFQIFKTPTVGNKDSKSPLVHLYNDKKLKVPKENKQTEEPNNSTQAMTQSSHFEFSKTHREKSESTRIIHQTSSSNRANPEDYRLSNEQLRYHLGDVNSRIHREVNTSVPVSENRSYLGLANQMSESQVLKKKVSGTSVANDLKESEGVKEENMIKDERIARKINQQSICSFVNEPSITRNNSIVSHSPGVTVIRHYSSSMILRTPEPTLFSNTSSFVQSLVNKSIFKQPPPQPSSDHKKFESVHSSSSRIVYKGTERREEKLESLPTTRGTTHHPMSNKPIDHNIYAKTKININPSENGNSTLNKIGRQTPNDDVANIYLKNSKIVVTHRPEVRKLDLKMSFGNNVKMNRY